MTKKNKKDEIQPSAKPTSARVVVPAPRPAAAQYSEQAVDGNAQSPDDAVGAGQHELIPQIHELQTEIAVLITVLPQVKSSDKVGDGYKSVSLSELDALATTTSSLKKSYHWLGAILCMIDPNATVSESEAAGSSIEGVTEECKSSRRKKRSLHNRARKSSVHSLIKKLGTDRDKQFKQLQKRISSILESFDETLNHVVAQFENSTNSVELEKFGVAVATAFTHLKEAEMDVELAIDEIDEKRAASKYVLTENEEKKYAKVVKENAELEADGEGEEVIMPEEPAKEEVPVEEEAPLPSAPEPTPYPNANVQPEEDQTVKPEDEILPEWNDQQGPEQDK